MRERERERDGNGVIEAREREMKTSVTRKKCQLSKKLPKNDFTRKMID